MGYMSALPNCDWIYDFDDGVIIYKEWRLLDRTNTPKIK